MPAPACKSQNARTGRWLSTNPGRWPKNRLTGGTGYLARRGWCNITFIMLITSALKKRCTNCGALKPLSLFYRRKEKRDRRSSWCKQCMTARVMMWRKTNGKRLRAINIRYERNNKEKLRACRKTHNRLARGEITRPKTCTKCGKRCQAHGHHPDYAKPNFIVWLCPFCHKQEHLIKTA